MKRVMGIIMGTMLLGLSGCVAPQSFVKTLEPTWASVELRTEVDYDQAWEVIIDTLVKRFDLEVLSKENG